MNHTRWNGYYWQGVHPLPRTRRVTVADVLTLALGVTALTLAACYAVGFVAAVLP